MQVLSSEAVTAALPFDRLIPALHQRFAEGCTVPPRQVLTLDDPAGGPGVTSLLMSAWDPGRHHVVKVVNVAPGNAARGLPGVNASVLLHDAATGVPLALMDGDAITARRTVAASALAGSWLARADARELLVLGAGRLAALLPEAWRAVRPIERVRIWARRPEQAEALAAQLRARRLDPMDAHPAGQVIDIQAVHDLPAAVAKADIVSCATLATAPLVQGAWLRPGSHLDLIGSFTPTMREADGACFTGAEVFIDTEEALAKSGDLLAPIANGAWRREDLRGTLAQLARGEVAGRSGDAARTVFKSVGTALEDLAAAVLAWEGSSRA